MVETHIPTEVDPVMPSPIECFLLTLNSNPCHDLMPVHYSAEEKINFIPGASEIEGGPVCHSWNSLCMRIHTAIGFCSLKVPFPYQGGVIRVLFRNFVSKHGE